MKWNAWGDPDAAKPLSDGIRSLLEQALGVTTSTATELMADEVRLRPSALADSDRDGLAAIVGAEYVARLAEAITRGTGNVFADLGYADAEERQTKLRLAHAINDVIARRRLAQTAAAERLGVSQPKVSALANYKLDGFSVERLMTFLTALDRDVEIVIRRKPRSRAAGRISVVAA